MDPEVNLVPALTIATLHSAGKAKHDEIPQERLAKLEDLRGKKIDQYHRIVFTEKQVAPHRSTSC